MVSRREFLAGGIAISALPVMAGLAAGEAGRAAAPGATPIYKVLYDERFPECCAYGRAAARRGFAVHAIRGDITDVWYHDFYPTWKRKPVAIAGLTAYGAFFCLERLAWDFGMRVSARDERPDGLISWVIVPRGRGVFA